jgi:uncharacterized peroxidase-related enzyme
MARLAAIDPARTHGRAKSLLSGARAIRGGPTTLELTLATSPAALEGYFAFLVALGGGLLTPRVREQIALAVADANGSDYCLAEHAAAGRRAGLSDADIADSRASSSEDPRADAALQFAHAVLAHRGHLSDDDLERVRAAGWSDGEIAELVANVALNVFTNYVTNVARTELDLPRVDERTPHTGRGSSMLRRVELLL